jgi:hypothetical protein
MREPEFTRRIVDLNRELSGESCVRVEDDQIPTCPPDIILGNISDHIEKCGDNQTCQWLCSGTITSLLIWHGGAFVRLNLID